MVLIVCVSCNSASALPSPQNTDPVARVLSSPVATFPSTATAIHTLETTSIAESSSTISPPPTQEPTWAAVPTLPAPDAQATLSSLSARAEACNLPCWWGITPGKTTWVTARSELALLGELFGPFDRGPIAWYDFAIAVPKTLDPLGYFEPSIGVRNGVVEIISLNGQWVWSGFDYSLAGLLQTFGQPDEIWLKTNADSPPEHGVPYDLDLYYGSKGVLFNATGRGTKQGDQIVICPQPFRLGAFPPGIVLWSPAESKTHAELLRWIVRGNFSNTQGYLPLEQVSVDFRREDFVATYAQANAASCFNIQPSTTP